MTDVSKLRLRRNAHPHDCEEGLAGGVGGGNGNGVGVGGGRGGPTSLSLSNHNSQHRRSSNDRLDLHLSPSNASSSLDLHSMDCSTKNSMTHNSSTRSSMHCGKALPSSSTRKMASSMSVSSGSSSVGPVSSNYGAIVKGRRKRRRRREMLKQQLNVCLKGFAATCFSLSLSLFLLPFSWVQKQVDYDRFVEHEIEYLVQVLKDSRSNSRTWVRGIHSKHPPRQIVCSDGLTLAIENDDYCDCPDGRDEFLTSACSHLLVNNHDEVYFTCHDPHKTRIYTSRVNDGIVDCPDGSDETSLIKSITGKH